jgi:GntP family gluconate:H+ symporter
MKYFNLMLLAVNTNQLLIGLLVGVVALVIMVTLTKIHAFLALIISSMIVGLVGGIPLGTIGDIISSGFGSTLGSIGIIIGLGVIMGQIFEESGAAEKMARTFIRLFGKGREHIALAVTGFIVSIPIFCDSAFIILFPIAKAISQKTRKNLVILAGCLAAGLVITHTLVPPTPGPLYVANAFGIGLGDMILWGIIVAIPVTVACIYYVKWVGKKLIIIPDSEGKLIKTDKPELVTSNFDLSKEPDKELPSATMSFAPIIIPIILILLNQVIPNVVKVNDTWKNILSFIGNPITAVAVGTLIAIYGLAFRLDRKTALRHMDKGINSAGIILLVTGAGGALGNVIKSSGVGTIIAENITRWGIPAILIPFLIATIVRFIQGSGTVALTTSAAISAPILANTNVSPLFAALAAVVGGFFFSYFNDSYFHVVNRSIGVEDSKDQLKLWSGTTTVAWLSGLIVVLILNLFLGNLYR